MNEARRRAYLEALGFDVWVARPAAPAGGAQPAASFDAPFDAPADNQHGRIQVGSGRGSTLLVCSSAADSASKFAADVVRALGGDPAWAWPVSGMVRGAGGDHATLVKSPLGQSTDSVTTIRHQGGINGFITIIVRVPETKDLVVLFNNAGPAPLGGMSRAILGILHGKPFAPPKITIVDTLLATTLTEGVEAAVKRYAALKSITGDKYDLAENQLNTLGYQLLGLKRIKDAIRIFQLNVELFPDAFNPYDSLGEAYMMDGQKDLAIKSYAKSLELNPGNTGAITMLGRIQKMK